MRPGCVHQPDNNLSDLRLHVCGPDISLGEFFMWLPTQAQVNAATRNIASAAGGAVLMLGLSTKIDPAAVTALVNAMGEVVGSIVTVLGIIAPLWAAYHAAQSASAKAQAESITKTVPGTVVVTSQAIADATPNSPNVVSSTDVKVVKQ
jgi:hypothetical protein